MLTRRLFYCMNNKKGKQPIIESSNNFKRNLLLASIPVIGSIIIALISQPSFKCRTTEITKVNYHDIDSTKKIENLKLRAGRINEDIVFRHYDDVRINMVEGIKPVITREVLKSNMDSVNFKIGNYIKTLDTSYSKINNVDVFFIRNQFQQGIHLVQVIFDNQGKIFGLFSNINAP